MGLAGCPKCWDALCCCGFEYRSWSIEELRGQIRILEKIIKFKEENPNVRFSLRYPDIESEKRFMKAIR